MRNKKLSLFAGSVILYMENLKLENPKEHTHTRTHRNRQMELEGHRVCAVAVLTDIAELPCKELV